MLSTCSRVIFFVRSGTARDNLECVNVLVLHIQKQKTCAVVFLASMIVLYHAFVIISILSARTCINYSYCLHIERRQLKLHRMVFTMVTLCAINSIITHTFIHILTHTHARACTLTLDFGIEWAFILLTKQERI